MQNVSSFDLEPVRGTNDVLPAECETLSQLGGELTGTFVCHGYRPVDVPIIEHTDLVLKKAGEEIAARLYAFVHHNRKICLRPEFTASVMRSYIHNMQSEPLPVRLSYSGPAFRYEKPQRGRYRQFTQVGVELIGSSSPMADAEVIHLACRGLDAVGLGDYRLVVGHVGVLLEFLEQLGLDEHIRSVLVASLESLGKEGQGMAHVRARVREFCPELPGVCPTPETSAAHRESESTEATVPSSALRRFLHTAGEAEAIEIIRELLATTSIGIEDSSRSPEEILGRLIAKLKRQEQAGRLERALAFMKELGQLQGSPADVLKEAGALLDRHELKHSPLDQLREILALLDAYKLNGSRITLDFGLGRGLQYYTGVIFEVHHNALGSESQVCGGGRYDDLIRLLGGRSDVPACGFSYGLERVKLALEAETKLPAKPSPMDALVIPVSPAENAYAVGVAEQLRDLGLRVSLDIREHSVKAGLKYADRFAIPFVVIVGSREAAEGSAVVRNMGTREEKTVAVGQLGEAVR